MSYQAKPGLIETDLGDELVLLDPQTQGMFTLNSVGMVVWRNLEGGLSSALPAVLNEFEVEAQVAEADIQELVGQLEQAGLIRWV